jgi:hypothetical protein
MIGMKKIRRFQPIIPELCVTTEKKEMLAESMLLDTGIYYLASYQGMCP